MLLAQGASHLRVLIFARSPVLTSPDLKGGAFDRSPPSTLFISFDPSWRLV
jgi:hypothetical protein